jgi:hypothetical protein
VHAVRRFHDRHTQLVPAERVFRMTCDVPGCRSAPVIAPVKNINQANKHIARWYGWTSYKDTNVYHCPYHRAVEADR